MKTEPPLRIIHAADLEKRLGVSAATAYRRYQQIKNSFNKKKHQILLNTEVAKFLGISVEEFERL